MKIFQFLSVVFLKWNAAEVTLRAALEIQFIYNTKPHHFLYESVLIVTWGTSQR